MRCPTCGKRFKANWRVARSPGGQEAPGTFLFLGLLVAVAGAALLALELRAWGGIALAVSAFILIQAPMALGDCRPGECPHCDAPVHVRIWSR